MEYIFVFTGNKAMFPSGVFLSFNKAKEWIEQNKLSGVLNKMPVNIGLYDWAIENDFFTPKKDYHKESRFIESFTCASMEHWHFEKGKE